MKLTLNSITGRTALAASVLSLFTLAGCEKNHPDPVTGPGITGTSDAKGQEIVHQHVPNEMLVKFKAGTSAQLKAMALEKVGGKIKEHILTKAMERAGDKEGVMLINTPLEAVEAISKIKGGSEIEFAEPNYIYTHAATSADTYFANGQLWGMYGDGSTPANQYGSQAAKAWANGNTGSAPVVIGIIDEGVQTNHPELAGQMWVNPYDRLDGIDNDGNGYIDDVNGWDFDGNNNSVYDGGTSGGLDDHGTHVAGTIGAKSNTSGVAGVAWDVTMISCKFLGRRGGTAANSIKAIDYLNDLKTRHSMNIVASNNSWGGGGFSQAVSDAIGRANTRDILFIAAAGNGGGDQIGDNNDAVANYPSNYNQPNIIAVASITSTGARSSFSNYGATTVDIGAPGSGIISSTAFNSLSSYNGTSMATPHVTGGVVLYAATHPGSTAATIKNAILSSAVPTASLSGKCTTGGRLNVSGF